MARYTAAVCRLCRRETAASKTGEKIKLFLKGDRCLSRKCAVERRGTAPGQKTQGTKARQKISEYGRQLREKQKMRRYYGVLETQFENYFREAQRVPGQTGKFFLQTARTPSRQRRLSPEPGDQPQAGAPARHAPSLPRQRPDRQHPVVHREARRRDHDRRAPRRDRRVQATDRSREEPPPARMARVLRDRRQRRRCWRCRAASRSTRRSTNSSSSNTTRANRTNAAARRTIVGASDGARRIT